MIRTRHLRSAGATCVLALALASPAKAAPFTPELDRAYNVAVRFWDETPTECATVDMEILPDALMPEGTEGWATIPEPGSDCVLYLQRTLAAPRNVERACAVLIHERGHLLGYQHSTDSRNVMYPQVVRIPGVCKRFGLREMNRQSGRPDETPTDE